MTQAIHISQARKLLDSGERVDLRIIKRSDGSVLFAKDCVSLSYDFYKGTRTIKMMRSGQKRTIYDCCIIGINDFDVFL